MVATEGLVREALAGFAALVAAGFEAALGAVFVVDRAVVFAADPAVTAEHGVASIPVASCLDWTRTATVSSIPMNSKVQLSF